jgi:hypothetical protein
MPVYRLAAHIAALTGLPRDDSVNTFYFASGSAMDNGKLDSIAAYVDSFYNSNPAGHGTHVSDYYAWDRDRGSGKCSFKWYLMPGAPGPIGSPIHTSTWTFGSSVTSLQNLPDNDAACLSYRGDITGVTNLRRHRGRIFLGPLNSLALQNTGSANTVPQALSGTMIAVMLGAAEEMAAAVAALSWSPAWHMWSPTDWVSRLITQVSVDDRPDSQRRRLERASSRTSHSIP